MCGICGFKGFQDHDLIVRMLNSIVHRGPDDHGIFEGDDVAIANRRLSIIDLSTGKQPIFNEKKDVVVVYNGEIYNFKELRDNLKKLGHKFKTKTDTEVIVHAYEEYGLDCLKMFNGMFAFALWDKKKKQLLLARDRLGIKPLYYYKRGDKFLFSSEAKSILEFPGYKRSYNPEAIIDYFTYHYISGDKTFFKDIHLLEPAHYILMTKDKFIVDKYWNLKYSPSHQSGSAMNFRSLFDSAVQSQMISDVEVGSCLSGGFDSSSVSISASKKVDKKLSVFTIGFDSSSRYDERPLAKKVSESIDVNVFERSISGKEFPPLAKSLIYFLDDPRNGVPTFSQYLLAELISEKVKVVLTGHGGDELFAGYHVFKSFNFLDKFFQNPLWALTLPKLFKSHEFLRGMYFVGFPFLNKEVKKTGLFVVFNKSERKKLFTKRFYNQIKDYDPSDIKEIPKSRSFSEKAVHAYTKIYLPTLLLVQDKMGMAHSVEARMPICDNSLLDFSLSLSMDDKLRNNELKSIIKSSMKPLLPKELYNQPKKGFPTPFALWFKGELRPYLYNLLLDKRTINRGIFKKRYIKHLLDKYTKPGKDSKLSLIGVNKLWCLLMTELWFRVFIDKDDLIIKNQNFKRHEQRIIK